MRRLQIVITIALLASAVTPALGEPLGLYTLGPRIGFRLDPDQFILGGQGSFWHKGEHLRFAGTMTLGLGDSTTLLGVTPELHYVVIGSPVAQDSFFYIGLGLDLAFSWVSTTGETVSDTDLGLTVLGGIERRLPGAADLFGEFRLYIHDPNDWFELVLGVNFIRSR